MDLSKMSNNDLVNCFQSEITNRLMNAGRLDIIDEIILRVQELRKEILNRMK